MYKRQVEEFAKGARKRGIKVIIAAAGMAAALPGVIAANTTLPVICLLYTSWMAALHWTVAMRKAHGLYWSYTLKTMRIENQKKLRVENELSLIHILGKDEFEKAS